MNIVKKDLNTSQAVGIGATVTLWTYRVPTKAQIRLTDFGNYVDTVAAWGDIHWYMKINGIGKYPYNDILDQIGHSARPRAIEPIIIHGGDEIIITVFNDTAGIVQCGIALRYEEIEV